MWRPSHQTSAVPPTDANLNSISLEYSYDDIARASRNFAQSNLLGKGSYGSVYRGILKDGTEVAIKVLNNPKDSGFKEEVLVLSKFRHPNLVILMGFSRHGKDRYLIYELLPGGDLCSRLQTDPAFDWRKRMACCLDAALGLSHLHNASPKVFHRDIKTQNILLDRNGTAKMADFGLALLAQPKVGLRVEQCSGTLGYADPLYISSSMVTERTEVYSLGMVLLEVLTGKPPAIQHPVTGQVQYVYTHLRGDPRAVMAMVQWRAGWPPEMAQRVAKLALACIDKSESNRPVFVDIVARLRDLISRSASLQAVVQAHQNIAQPRRDNPLMQNQLQLEEALMRLNAGHAAAQKANVAAPVADRDKAKWNPFDLSEEDVPAAVAIAPVIPAPSPPVAPVTPPAIDPPVQPPGRKESESSSVRDTESNGSAAATASAVSSRLPPPPSSALEETVTSLVNKAVTDFDQELRVMSSAKEAETVERAMQSLFPSDSTVGSPAGDADEDSPESRQKREIAKHLLSAGFQMDQVREALKRTRSVEAAVEWIVEQRWS